MRKSLIISLLGALISIAEASACPNSNGIPDFNCDGRIVVAVVGDSLVYGFGDIKNGNKGGYVLRAQKALPDVDFINLGIQGLHTGIYLRALIKDYSSSPNSLEIRSLEKADIVVLDLGRNDRWEMGLPSATLRNLQRLKTVIQTNAVKAGNTTPWVVTAVNMLPNRGSQGPWVKDLNALIVKSKSKLGSFDLRFDLVSKRLLGEDQIHPTPAGYTALAKTFVKYLTKTLPQKMLKERTDSDDDGVADVFETEKFGTDPALKDTDGDGVADGKEIFKDKTDPLVPDPAPVA